MKLDCPVVRDLYVLYIENELSPEVRAAVEEHLGECAECGKLYEEGVGISEVLGREDNEVPSSKLDEKMLLKLKIGRLKVGVLVLAIMFVMSVFNFHYNSRKNLSQDISMATSNMGHLWQSTQFDFNANSEQFRLNITELNNLHSTMTREFNFIEKMSLKDNYLYLQENFIKMLEILDYKRTSNALTERDQKARQLLEEYSLDAVQLLETERNSLNNIGYNWKIFLPFKQIKVKKLGEIYAKINELTLTYVNYNRLPEELYPLSEAELIEKIKSALDDNDIKIQFDGGKPRIMSDGSIRFYVDGKNLSNFFNASIDAYTGILLGFEDIGNFKSGEPITKENAEINALNLLRRLYGDICDYKLKYKGINYRISGAGDLHSFECTPVIDSFEFFRNSVSEPNEKVGIRIYVDSKGGRVVMMRSPFRSVIPFINRNENVTLDKSINLTPEQGLNNLKISDKDRYSFKGTYVITSKIYNRNLLAHVYQNKDSGLSVFINTAIGNQDFEY